MIDRVGSALSRRNPWVEGDGNALRASDGGGDPLHRNPEELDVYCYRTGANDHTCLLLSDQSEADFLLRYGSDELNVAY